MEVVGRGVADLRRTVASRAVGDAVAPELMCERRFDRYDRDECPVLGGKPELSYARGAYLGAPHRACHSAGTVL